MTDSNKLDEAILKYLSDNQRKEILREMGFAPKLPFIVKSIDDDKAYSANEVAELLGFTPHHIRRLCREAKIVCVQVSGKGGSYRIFGEEIKRFILNRINYFSMEKRLQ